MVKGHRFEQAQIWRIAMDHVRGCECRVPMRRIDGDRCEFGERLECLRKPGSAEIEGLPDDHSNACFSSHFCLSRLEV